MFLVGLKKHEAGFVVFSVSVPGHFYCVRGPSLVELTGDDISASSPVAVV